MINRWPEKGEDSQQLGLLQLSTLCAAFFANEITATYELIYMVSIERLLSLPLQFVSLPGVVASASTFVIVPFMGRYTDNGNQFRRRSAMVILSGVLQFTGALLLLTACTEFICIEKNGLKVDIKHDHEISPEISKGNKETNIINVSLVSDGGKNSTEFVSHAFLNWTIIPHSNQLDSEFGENLQNSHAISSPLTACLALVAFSVMAIGFDVGTSSIRSFVLDTVPAEVHSQVLSVGVMMSSLGGCVFALLGRIDISPLIGQDIDSTLFRGVFLSSFLMFAVAVTVPLTIIYGNHLKSKLGKSEHQKRTTVEIYELEEVNRDSQCPLLKNIPEELIEKEGENEPINFKCDVTQSIKGVEDFEEKSQKTCSNQSMKNSKEKYCNIEKQRNINYRRLCGEVYETVQNDATTVMHTSCNMSSGDTHEEAYKTITNDQDESTPLVFSDFQRSPTCDAQQVTKCGLKKTINTPRFRLLVLICLVTFFSSGTSISFEVYFSTFLSVGVFKGDPEAPLGSDPKHHFDQGTMVASEGTLIFMVTFFLYNFVHWEVVQRIGLIPEYLLISVLAMPLLLAMALLKHLGLFYVVACFNGIYRNILFTTPFVMATEVIDAEKGNVSCELKSPENRNNEITVPGNINGQDSSKEMQPVGHPDNSDHASYGTTIAIVGAMLPLSDLVLSCMMGPLLEATSDPALPMLFGFSSGVAAALALIAIAAYKWRAGV